MKFEQLLSDLSLTFNSQTKIKDHNPQLNINVKISPMNGAEPVANITIRNKTKSVKNQSRLIVVAGYATDDGRSGHYFNILTTEQVDLSPFGLSPISIALLEVATSGLRSFLPPVPGPATYLEEIQFKHETNLFHLFQIALIGNYFFKKIPIKKM